jgi:hypothetical protein
MRTPSARAHAGTQDVDIVIDIQMLTNTEAYRTLEENLHKLGFERAENRNGQRVSWRWRTRTEKNTVILELLADMPDAGNRRVNPLPTEGSISAVHIPHASIVFDLYETIEIRAELLGENGIATVKVKHANLISFTCLKAFAFDERNERKDAHDLIYCLEHCSNGFEHAAAEFLQELNGKHGDVIRRALDILHKRFAHEETVEGYRKDGPVAVAKFEHGEDDELREARILRQREASDLVDRLLAAIGSTAQASRTRHSSGTTRNVPA